MGTGRPRTGARGYLYAPARLCVRQLIGQIRAPIGAGIWNVEFEGRASCGLTQPGAVAAHGGLSGGFPCTQAASLWKRTTRARVCTPCGLGGAGLAQIARPSVHRRRREDGRGGRVGARVRSSDGGTRVDPSRLRGSSAETAFVGYALRAPHQIDSLVPCPHPRLGAAPTEEPTRNECRPTRFDLWTLWKKSDASKCALCARPRSSHAAAGQFVPCPPVPCPAVSRHTLPTQADRHHHGGTYPFRKCTPVRMWRSDWGALDSRDACLLNARTG